ncbi:MAG: hypothetical protein IJ337_05925 [Clostridia bacterium]|nr:hypothetical protein [Clostridia bacterium]
MKTWSTLFFILAILMFILSVVGLAGGVAPFIACLVSALSFMFFSKLCSCVTTLLDNQKTILENQRKLLIMVDNLTE